MTKWPETPAHLPKSRRLRPPWGPEATKVGGQPLQSQGLSHPGLGGAREAFFLPAPPHTFSDLTLREQGDHRCCGWQWGTHLGWQLAQGHGCSPDPWDEVQQSDVPHRECAET